MTADRILWVDDEIELLKPHIIFLEGKGYAVDAATSGSEALEMIDGQTYDIIFLDEHMPGLSGIETLERIKAKQAHIPVVMITKSEEEQIMEDAIGSKIADYLIKPVNPHQILLALKKNLENKKLVRQKTTSAYQQEFRQIGMNLSMGLDFTEWIETYQKLVFWELELDRSRDESMSEVLKMQKEEANQMFSRYVQDHYRSWMAGSGDRPIQSHMLLREKVFPQLGSRPLFLLVIDNLRYDQWKALQPLIEEDFRVVKDEIYYSILPTTTQFARNALFSGLMPGEIQKKYPQYWVNEDEEGGKNQFESELLGENLRRFGFKSRYTYHKILNLTAGRKLVETLPNLMQSEFNVIVYNFVDMLSHARTEMEVIRELAGDESAYRSLTLSWYEHSPLRDILQFLASRDVDLIITSDHGSIKVKDPVKVVGDKQTTTNLRYKSGRSLSYKEKEVAEPGRPEELFLPRLNVSSRYIFARATDFFAYPNNYNHYVNYYRNTFQHGGISLEEVLVPLVFLKPRMK